MVFIHNFTDNRKTNAIHRINKIKNNYKSKRIIKEITK